MFPAASDRVLSSCSGLREASSQSLLLTGRGVDRSFMVKTHNLCSCVSSVLKLIFWNTFSLPFLSVFFLFLSILHFLFLCQCPCVFSVQKLNNLGYFLPPFSLYLLPFFLYAPFSFYPRCLDLRRRCISMLRRAGTLFHAGRSCRGRCEQETHSFTRKCVAGQRQGVRICCLIFSRQRKLVEQVGRERSYRCSREQ